MLGKIQCSAEVKVSYSGKVSHDASANCSIESNAAGEVMGDDKSATVTAEATAPAVTGQVPEPTPEFAQKLLDRLYDCRKIEIEHLWQRSVFLGTFIVLAFSGYGMLVGKMLDRTCDTNNQTICMEQAHLVGMVCGCILLFLGVLWVCMAKGSKRWQELYERKIVLLEDQIFEKGFDQFKYKCEFRQNPEHDEGNQKKECNCIFIKERKSCSGNPEAGEDLAQSRCFCSLGAGPYSPSKINILLGWFTCLAGMGILLFHYNYFYRFDGIFDNFITHLNENRLNWLIVCLIIFICVWQLIIRDLFKEQAIEDKMEKGFNKLSVIVWSGVFFMVVMNFPLESSRVFLWIAILIFLIQFLVKHK